MRTAIKVYGEADLQVSPNTARVPREIRFHWRSTPRKKRYVRRSERLPRSIDTSHHGLRGDSSFQIPPKESHLWALPDNSSAPSRNTTPQHSHACRAIQK